MTGYVTQNGLINAVLGKTKTVNSVYANIDLTEAKLIGVTQRGFQTSEFKLPIGPNYLMIENPEWVYNSTHQEISRKWTGKRKDLGLRLLNGLYMPKNGEKNMFVDSNYFKYSVDQEIFDLLKEQQ